MLSHFYDKNYFSKKHFDACSLSQSSSTFKIAYFIRSKITFVTCNKNLIQEGKYELFHSQPVRDVVSDFCLTVTVILALKGFSG